MYYVKVFILFSIVGFWSETVFYWICQQQGESGFLWGPWTPVYGFGIVIITVLSSFIKKQKWTKWKEVLYLFIMIALTLGILEYVGGILVEKLFDRSMWDYRNFRFSIGQYTSLEMMGIWGILGVFYSYIIQPWIDRWIPKIPAWIFYGLLILFGIDLFLIGLSAVFK